eukprot:115581-Chlamydomonas_euryale.AAC.4
MGAPERAHGSTWEHMGAHGSTRESTWEHIGGWIRRACERARQGHRSGGNRACGGGGPHSCVFIPSHTRVLTPSSPRRPSGAAATAGVAGIRHRLAAP